MSSTRVSPSGATSSKPSSTTIVQSSTSSHSASSDLPLSPGEASSLVPADTTNTSFDSTSSGLPSSTSTLPVTPTPSSQGPSQLLASGIAAESSGETMTLGSTSADQPTLSPSPFHSTTTTSQVVTSTSLGPSSTGITDQKTAAGPSFAHNPGAIAAMLVFAGIIMAAVCFCIFWTVRRRRYRQQANIEPFPAPTYPFEYPGNQSLMRNVTNDRNEIAWGSRGFGSVNGDGGTNRLSAQFSPTEFQHNLAGIGANPAAIYRGTQVQDPFADYMANDINASTDHRLQSPTTPNSAASTPSFYLSSLAHIKNEIRDPSYKRESGSELSQTDTIQVPLASVRPLQLSLKKNSRMSNSPPLSPKLLSRCDSKLQESQATSSELASNSSYRPESLISEISIPAPSKSMESFHESLGASGKSLYSRRTLLDVRVTRERNLQVLR